MADDEQQRRLEVVKVRIDVAKHFTTLSGAATLILLALEERVKGEPASTNLGVAVGFFGFSTLLALFLMTRLLRDMDSTGPIRRLHGQRWTELAMAMFAAGVLALVLAAFETSPLRLAMYATAWAIVALVGRAIYNYWRHKRGSSDDKPKDSGPG